MYVIGEDLKDVKIEVKGLMGIIIAPYSDVNITCEDETGIAGVIIANNITNKAKITSVNKLDTDGLGMYSKEVDDYKDSDKYTWGNLKRSETLYRYKVTTDKVSHMKYTLYATYEDEIVYYGERLAAPDVPPTGPDVPPTTPPAGGPTGGDGGAIAPTFTAPVAAAPAPAAEVLGARRSEGGSVLGARRSLAPAVLGKKRAPETGDTMAVFGWLTALMGTLTGAGVSAKALKKSKKEDAE